MSKTAMQELIDALEEHGSENFDHAAKHFTITIDMSEYFDLKKQAKEKEKQQIIKARVTSPTFVSRETGEYMSDAYKREAEDYYNQTYNQ